MNRFIRYQLRTTDVAAARGFYASVLGEDEPTIVVPLPEPARARGARPHWLGLLDVGAGHLDATSAAFIAHGAQPLGPKWLTPEGIEALVVRDPGGAVVALAAQSQATNHIAFGIEWHILNTADVERAKTSYRELFGWHFEKPLELPEGGVLHPFAWQAGSPSAGAFYDIGERPGVHPHWLFHFAVPSLAVALEAVSRGGGLAIGPFSMPNGDTMAVCDDPQGAAFALLESPPSAAQ